jgi:hypothetical protein
MSPPALPLVRLALAFRAEGRLSLPPFRGALWRGVFGLALKRMAEGEGPPVETGPYRREELYTALFDPKPLEGRKMGEAPPPPFVIDAPPAGLHDAIKPGAITQFGLTLVGRAAEALPAVIAAFARAGEAGLGSERGAARLIAAHAVWRPDGRDIPVYADGGAVDAIAAAPPPVPPAPALARVALATPLRLIADKRLVGPREFRPGLLLANLVRRVSLLTAAHTGTPLATDFKGLKALYETLPMAAPDLTFADQHRWSAPQRKEIEMGGIVGSFTLPLAGFEPLWPYLWLAQWIGAGKGAAMGMGSIRFASA